MSNERQMTYEDALTLIQNGEDENDVAQALLEARVRRVFGSAQPVEEAPAPVVEAPQISPRDAWLNKFELLKKSWDQKVAAPAEDEDAGE